MNKETITIRIKAISAGTEMALSILSGGIIGYMAGSLFDETFEYSGLIIGVMLGLAAGTYMIYKKFK